MVVVLQSLVRTGNGQSELRPLMASPFSDTGPYFTHTHISHRSAYHPKQSIFQIVLTYIPSSLVSDRLMDFVSCLCQPAGLWRIYPCDINYSIISCMFISGVLFLWQSPTHFLLDMSLGWTEVGSPMNIYVDTTQGKMV